MCDKNCDNCFYRETINGGMPYCGYIFKTHHKRPCPAGKDCTVKVSRSVYRKRKRTPEEVAAAKERYKAKKRKSFKAYYEIHKDEINAKAKARREQKKEAICGS